VPTLLLAGNRDLSTPLPWARQELALAPRGRLVIVRGSGHSVQSRATLPAGRDAVRRFLLGGWTWNPGPLAQLVEQGTLNPKVEGSNPSRPILLPPATPFPLNHACHTRYSRQLSPWRAPPGAPPNTTNGTWRSARDVL